MVKPRTSGPLTEEEEQLAGSPPASLVTTVTEYLESVASNLGNERHPRVRIGERQPIPSWVRWAIWERDGRNCRGCGGAYPIELVELDHIVPWSAGGSDSGDNLRVLCVDCNQRRSNFVGTLDADRRQRVAAWCIDCMDSARFPVRSSEDVEVDERERAFCVRCGVVTWAAPEFTW